MSRRGPRPTAERMQRLLILLPWLMERGGASVAEAAARFQVSEPEIIRDLELAACCGLPPYVDEMIDVFVDDGEIHVGVPRLFTRPLRLTPAEGIALLAAGRAAQQLPGADVTGPLARALEKLAGALDATPNVAVDVEVPPFLALVRRAVERCERLAIRYYVASRDELADRAIDPQLAFLDRGRWYVVADDVGAGAERRFRIDRIEAAKPTGERFEHRPVAPPMETGWFAGADDVTMATLQVSTSGRWIAETYPVEEVEELAGDGMRVVLPVTSERWLERLLLRLGPDAVVESPTALADVGRRAATRLLAKYV
jgi:proteasome accessory factor C